MSRIDQSENFENQEVYQIYAKESMLTVFPLALKTDQWK